MPKQETLALVYYVIGMSLWTGLVGSIVYNNIDRHTRRPFCQYQYGCPCGECQRHHRKA